MYDTDMMSVLNEADCSNCGPAGDARPELFIASNESHQHLQAGRQGRKYRISEMLDQLCRLSKDGITEDRARQSTDSTPAETLMVRLFVSNRFPAKRWELMVTHVIHRPI
ncbi:unnamed protein product [Nesidiocoris tenuis]|uniref:Uncharacterized protein n=1 Tax=Nesidiocoris tenuis TaxID=355587 RepID=A0A6H5HTN8_9HEMI|nr:unnamed protein product [Nesidiocoris tenuis]